MKKLSVFLFFSFALLCIISCTKEEICTVCTEASSGVTSDFCGTDSAVGFFESELMNQGSAAGQSWSCVR